jgi:hypothetical protein
MANIKRLFSSISIKKMAVFFFSSIFLLFSTGCSLLAIKNAEDIHKNSNLEIGLLTYAGDGLFDENYGVIPGFGITGYYDKKYGGYDVDADAVSSCSVIYHVTSYPDVLSGKQYVTGIDVTDPEIEIYGYSVGDSVEGLETFLEEKGYKKFSDNGNLMKFKKAKMQFRCSVDVETRTIRSLYVGVNVTNNCGVIF